MYYDEGMDAEDITPEAIAEFEAQQEAVEEEPKRMVCTRRGEAMPSVMKSEFSCPACKKKTGELNQILANAGELMCSKDPSHTWNDTMDVLNLGPAWTLR